MTIESGSRRHSPDEGVGTGGVEATMAAYGNWQTYRTLDPIREAALANAVDLVQVWAPRPDEADTARATRVLHIATMFEAYLLGEEANDPTNP